MAKVIAKTYEGRNLVVQHVFFGETLNEAEAVLDAHLGTDSFLNASMEREVRTDHYKGEWDGLKLSTVITSDP